MYTRCQDCQLTQGPSLSRHPLAGTSYLLSISACTSNVCPAAIVTLRSQSLYPFFRSFSLYLPGQRDWIADCRR